MRWGDVTSACAVTGGQTAGWVRSTRVYEQSNHLGNVLTTLSDKVLGRLPDNAYVCSHYESIVISCTRSSWGLLLAKKNDGCFSLGEA